MAEPKDTAGSVPKARLDALSDGVFAFAMTLLVINLEFPDSFEPGTPAELIAGLRQLDGYFVVYIVSFLVLGVCWLGRVSTRGEPEHAGGAFVWSLLLYLFFVTLVPFSTMVGGRYDHLWPGVWLYAANMIALAGMAIVITYAAERETSHRQKDNGRIELSVLIASAVISAAVSLFMDGAMWAYLLNLASPLVKRVLGKA